MSAMDFLYLLLHFCISLQNVVATIWILTLQFSGFIFYNIQSGNILPTFLQHFCTIFAAGMILCKPLFYFKSRLTSDGFWIYITIFRTRSRGRSLPGRGCRCCRERRSSRSFLRWCLCLSPTALPRRNNQTHPHHWMDWSKWTARDDRLQSRGRSQSVRACRDFRERRSSHWYRK